ncbi:MAG: hypothetical protein H6895_03235 [Defluviimonas sp.]|uniref:hypothetical protein n=1 Tax=Albidovulum sp. TaxID=1872424 RepID=UPI002A2BD872|nr:hypothetical protein [Defluviimonas sp.]
MTDSPAPRRVTPRLWAALTLAGAAGSAAASPALVPLPITGGPERLWQVQTQAGEGGEGGESGAATADDAAATLDYLTELGQIEAQLRAAAALADAGQSAGAEAHLDIADEIYSEIEPELESFGGTGLTEPLAEAGASIKDGTGVAEALAAALAEFDTARDHARAPDAVQGAAIVALLRAAADSYATGVAGGALGDPAAYRQAWGLAETARHLVGRMAEADDEKERTFAGKALEAMADLSAVLPAIDPKGQALGDPSIPAAVAARVELAAYQLR